MPLRLGAELPSVKGATSWLSEPLTDDDLKGRFVLFHFWAVSCYVCKTQYPALKSLANSHPEISLVGIHMPRQEEDLDTTKVIEVAKELGITEPCAIDNEHLLKDAFQNDQGWVPSYFLFDQEGKLRSRTAGENGVSLLSNSLQRVLVRPNEVAA